MKGDVGEIRDVVLFQELSDSQKTFLEHLAEMMNIDSPVIWTAETVYEDHGHNCETCQEALRRIWTNESCKHLK